MKPPVPKTLRCAIYTRVSTDQGLEQEFNSLDNQRESAEAYVKSQAHEGWRCLPALYDDGGFSGGSLERPSLQRLLADIRARRVECRRGLQGGSADALAGGLRQAGRALRPARRLLRLRHAGIQYDQQHGAAYAQRA